MKRGVTPTVRAGGCEASNEAHSTVANRSSRGAGQPAASARSTNVEGCVLPPSGRAVTISLL
jgi:hypothetical protein